MNRIEYWICEFVALVLIYREIDLSKLSSGKFVFLIIGMLFLQGLNYGEGIKEGRKLARRDIAHELPKSGSTD